MSSSSKSKLKEVQSNEKKKQEERLKQKIQKIRESSSPASARKISKPLREEEEEEVPVKDAKIIESKGGSKRLKQTVETEPSSKTAELTSEKPERKKKLKFKNYIIDCDGVIWHGDEEIHGSIEALNRLQQAGCNLHFVTNGSASTRESIKNKLYQLGLHNVNIEAISTSGSAAADLIVEKYPTTRKVYVVGEEGLVKELEMLNIKTIGGFRDNETRARSSSEFLALEIDDNVDIVVCGIDRSFNYAKLAKASLYLQRPHCKLIVTNNDAYDTLPPKGHVPGAGCMVAAILHSLHHPNPPYPFEICGKPSKELLENILKQRKFQKNETIMIGDRLDTDIQFAINAKVKSCLVLSGVTKEKNTSANMTFDSLYDFVNDILK